MDPNATLARLRELVGEVLRNGRWVTCPKCNGSGSQ